MSTWIAPLNQSLRPSSLPIPHAWGSHSRPGPEISPPRLQNTGALRRLINVNDKCELSAIRQKVAGSLIIRYSNVVSNRHDVPLVPFLRWNVNYAGTRERSSRLPVHRVRRARITVQPSRIMASVGEITPYCEFGEHTWSMISRPTDKQHHPGQPQEEKLVRVAICI